MIPWLFGTRNWKFEKYWDKKFRKPWCQIRWRWELCFALRELMSEVRRSKLKICSKDIKKNLHHYLNSNTRQIRNYISNVTSIDILNKHYNKPSIETKKEYASKVSKVFKFIKGDLLNVSWAYMPALWKKKTTKYPITLDNRIGFMCEECLTPICGQQKRTTENKFLCSKINCIKVVQYMKIQSHSKTSLVKIRSKFKNKI